MFMGGIQRTVDDGGWFMVKTDPPFNIEGFTREERRLYADHIARESAQLATEDYDFVMRMGISSRLLSEIMYPRSRDGSTRRCLSREELRIDNVSSRFDRTSRDKPTASAKADETFQFGNK